MLQAGASGYVLKTASSEELIQAVRAVYEGESALSQEVTGKVVAQLTSGRSLGVQFQEEALLAGNLANIYGKLGVSSCTGAVTRALPRGWIVLHDPCGK